MGITLFASLSLVDHVSDAATKVRNKIAARMATQSLRPRQSKAPCCPNVQLGMRALLTSLHPDRSHGCHRCRQWLRIELEHNRDRCVTPADWVKTTQHRHSGNQTERTDPVNRQDRRSTVQICQRLNCMCKAFFLSFRGQCTLEWRGCCFHSWRCQLCDGPSDQSAHHATNAAARFLRTVSRPMRNNVSTSGGTTNASARAALLEIVMGWTSLTTRNRRRSTGRTLLLACQKRCPLSSREASIRNCTFWNLASSGRSVEQQPRKHQEQLPSGRAQNGLVGTNLVDLSQRDAHGLPVSSLHKPWDRLANRDSRSTDANHSKLAENRSNCTAMAGRGGSAVRTGSRSPSQSE